MARASVLREGMGEAEEAGEAAAATDALFGGIPRLAITLQPCAALHGRTSGPQ